MNNWLLMKAEEVLSSNEEDTTEETYTRNRSPDEIERLNALKKYVEEKKMPHIYLPDRYKNSCLILIFIKDQIALEYYVDFHRFETAVYSPVRNLKKEGWWLETTDEFIEILEDLERSYGNHN